MAEYYIEVGQQGVARLENDSPREIKGLITSGLQTCIGIVLIGANGKISLIHQTVDLTTTEIETAQIKTEIKWIGADQVKMCYLISNSDYVFTFTSVYLYQMALSYYFERRRIPKTWLNATSCCIERTSGSVIPRDQISDPSAIIVTPFIEERTCLNIIKAIYNPNDKASDLQFDGQNWTAFPSLRPREALIFQEFLAMNPDFDMRPKDDARKDKILEFLKQTIQQRAPTRDPLMRRFIRQLPEGDSTVTFSKLGTFNELAIALNGHRHKELKPNEFVKSGEESAIRILSGGYPFVIVQNNQGAKYAVCFFISRLIAAQVTNILSSKYKAECIEETRKTCPASPNKELYIVRVSLA